MEDDKICKFVDVADVWEEARGIFNEKKRGILELICNVDIQHVGSTVVPNSLTKKDLDIQVRVTKSQFNEAKKQLRKFFEPKHEKEIWQDDGFAVFVEKLEKKKGLESIDVLLVIKDSAYDEFHKARDLLLFDSRIRNAYNRLKKSSQGKPYSEYRILKRKFWGKNGEMIKLIK